MYFLPHHLFWLDSLKVRLRLACVQGYIFLVMSTQDKENVSEIVLLFSNICLFYCPSGQKTWTSVGTSRTEAASSSA